MPRKAAPGLPAAKAEIRKLKASLKMLTDDYDQVSSLRVVAESERDALVHQIRQTKPIANLESVNFERTPPRDTLQDELGVLYDLIRLLDGADPIERCRLLSMLDARYYDPPAKAAR
jgi:hypothetical protein